MAKKKTENTGNVDIDNLDLDFDFGDDLNIGGESNDKDSRKATLVTKGIITGARKSVFSPTTAKKLVRASLPKEAGEVLDNANLVTSAVSDLYDETTKELKPATRELTKQVNKLIPDEMRRTKAAMEKFQRSLGVADTPKKSDEEYRNEEIASKISDIFKEQNAYDTQQRVQEKSEDRLMSTIAFKQSNNQIDLLNQINVGVTSLANYNRTINTAYQKKSLELQYRMLYAMNDTFRMQKEYFAIFKEQNKDIVKNTALPEYVKLKQSERFKEIARTKFMDSAHNALFGNSDFLKKGIENLKTAAKDKIQRTKSAFEEAAFGIGQMNDAGDMMRDLGQNPYSAVGEEVGKGGIEFLASKAGSKLRKTFEKEDSKVGKFFKKVAKYGTNTEGAVDALGRSGILDHNYEDDGTFKGKAKNIGRGALSSILDIFTSGTDKKFDNSKGLKNMHENAVYSIKDQSALNTIIPGYLARIYRELQVTRTGDDKVGLTVFNNLTGKFTTESNVAKDVANLVKSSLKKDNADYDADRAIDVITGNKKLSDDTSIQVRNKLKDRAFSGRIVDVDLLKSDEFLDGLSSKQKTEFLKALEENLANEETSFETKDLNISRATTRIRQNLVDPRGLIQKLINAGHEDALKEMGLLDEKGDLDMSGMKKLMHDDVPKDNSNLIVRPRKKIELSNKDGKPTIVTSDVHAKMNIENYDPKKALNGIVNTSVSKWQYKPGKGDGKEHLGPMAQDVLKNLGPNSAPGGKAIDLISLNGQNMAAVKALNDKVDKGDPKLIDILKAINADTTAIKENTAKAGNGFILDHKEAINELVKGAKAEMRKKFTGIFGLVSQVIDKASEGIGSASDTASSMGKNGIKVAEKFYKDHKDGIAETIKKVTTSTFNLISSTAISINDKLKNIMQNTLPKGLKSLKAMAASAKDTVVDFLNKPRDIYIPGLKTPVLSAFIMETGGYFDQATGTVIKTLADIKGNVVDASGNVVLSAEQIKKGLFDKYGMPVKIMLKNWSSLFMGAGKSLLGMGMNAMSKLMEGGQSVSEVLNGLVKGFWTNTKNLLSLGYDKKSYNVLIQIRDILDKRLGGSNSISDQDKDGDRDGSVEDQGPIETKGTVNGLEADNEPKYKSSGSGLFGLAKNKLGDMLGKVSNKLPKTGKLGKMSSVIGKLVGSKDTDETKDQPEETSESKEKKFRLSDISKMMPAMTTVAMSKKHKKTDGPKSFNDRDGSGNRDGSWIDQVEDQKAKDKAHKEAINKATKQADNDPKYKSGKNVIDLMMEKAAGAASKITDGIGSLMDVFSEAKGGKLGKVKNILKRVKPGGLLKNGLGRLANSGVGRFVAQRLGTSAIMSGASTLAGASGAVGTGAAGAAAATGATVATGAAGAGAAAAGTGVAGTAAAAGGAGLLATLGIGLAVVGAVALVGYGAYKLYKYLKNKVTDTDKLRMIQYGFGEDLKNERSRIMKLEGYLQEKVLTMNGEEPSLPENKLDVDLILSIFDLTAGKGSDRSKESDIRKFHQWYKERFIPVFFKHIKAIKKLNSNFTLDNVSKLKDKDLSSYLNSINVDDSVWNIIGSPIAGPGKLTTSKVEFDKLLSTIKQGAPLSATNKVLSTTGLDGSETKIDTTLNPSKPKPKDNSLEGQLGLKKDKDLVSAKGAVTQMMNMRNPTALDVIRFKSYGLVDLDNRFIRPIKVLETYLNNKVKIGGDKTAKLDMDMQSITDAVGKDFGLSYNMTYSSLGTEDYQWTQWSKWFELRFLPVYLTYVSEINRLANTTNIETGINKLNVRQQYELGMKISSLKDIWNLSWKAFKNVAVNTDKSSVDQNLLYLENQVKVEKINEQKATAPKANSNPAPGSQVQPPVNSLMQKQIEEANKKRNQGSVNPDSEAKVNPGSSSAGDSNTNLGKPTLAGGPMASGAGGSQFIKLQTGVDTKLLNPQLWQQFQAMAEEFGKLSGKSITVTSAGRSSEAQAKLYAQNPNKAAPPGRSLHEFGLALDADSKTLDEMDQLGLMRKYGFTRPVGGETWHVEPAGIQGSNRDVAKKDLNAAMQLISASVGKGGGGMGATPGSPLGKRNDAAAVKLAGLDIKPNNPPASTGITGITASKDNSVPMMATADKSSSVETPSSRSNRSGSSGYGGSMNNTTFAATAPPKNKAEVLSVLDNAASKTGVDPNTLKTFAAVESGLNPQAKAKGTSAEGLMQFLDTTWKETTSKYGSKYGINSDTPKTDANASSLMGAEYIKSNMKTLQSVKPNPTATDAYLAHFLGAGGAKKILKSEPSKDAAEVVPSAASSNKNMFYDGKDPKSVSELYQTIDNKMNKAATSFGITPPSQSAMFNKDFSDGNSKSQFNDNPSVAKVNYQNTVTKPSPKKTGINDYNPFAKTKASTEVIQQSLTPGIQTASGDKQLDSIDGTLIKSLDVQTQMLEVLKGMANKLNTASDSSAKENTEEVDKGFTKEPFQSTNSRRLISAKSEGLPKPTVSLKRSII